MSKPTLILASQSPRRKELLGQLGYPFTVCPAQGEEVMDTSVPPDVLVGELASQKALEVMYEHRNAVVIGADTVVVVDNTLLGKPKDKEEAIAMVTLLQGNTHTVYTGVCVVEECRQALFTEKTEVTMRALTPEQVRAYVAQGESMDKAGGYGIQGLGAWLVEEIKGDYFNVMGLPLCALGKILPDFGIELFGSEAEY